MSEETIGKEAFAAILAEAGLTKLSDEQVEDLRAAYKYVKEMKERVRTPRGREAEPAHIFTIPPEAVA